MQLKSFLIFIVCCALCEKYVQADVTCTAGKFIAGNPGILQCDFGTDVTKDKLDFNVVRYAFDDTTYENRINVLACSWTGDKMDCPVTEPGYNFDHKVDSKLTLLVYKMDKSMTGLYRCQLVPKPDNTDMHTCNLTVIDISMTSNSATAATTAKADETTHADNSQSPSEGASWAAVYGLISVVVFLVMIIIVGIILVICYLRKRFLFGEKDNYCPWLPCSKASKKDQHNVDMKDTLLNESNRSQTVTTKEASTPLLANEASAVSKNELEMPSSIEKGKQRKDNAVVVMEEPSMDHKSGASKHAPNEPKTNVADLVRRIDKATVQGDANVKRTSGTTQPVNTPKAELTKEANVSPPESTRHRLPNAASDVLNNTEPKKPVADPVRIPTDRATGQGDVNVKRTSGTTQPVNPPKAELPKEQESTDDLKDEESDTWTKEQVKQWLTNNNFSLITMQDGKGLLEITSVTDSRLFHMDGTESGKLVNEIEKLREAVEERKRKERLER